MNVGAKCLLRRRGLSYRCPQFACERRQSDGFGGFDKPTVADDLAGKDCSQTALDAAQQSYGIVCSSHLCVYQALGRLRVNSANQGDVRSPSASLLRSEFLQLGFLRKAGVRV